MGVGTNRHVRFTNDSADNKSSRIQRFVDSTKCLCRPGHNNRTAVHTFPPQIKSYQQNSDVPYFSFSYSTGMTGPGRKPPACDERREILHILACSTSTRQPCSVWLQFIFTRSEQTGQRLSDSHPRPNPSREIRRKHSRVTAAAYEKERESFCANLQQGMTAVPVL